MKTKHNRTLVNALDRRIEVLLDELETCRTVAQIRCVKETLEAVRQQRRAAAA